MNRKIKRLVKISKEVFKNCSLPNGAIIAADVSNPLYPKDVKWYGFVWPRDAAFVVVAADLLGMKKIGTKFFEWVWKNADGIKDTGLVLAQQYFPNGIFGFKHDIVKIKPEFKNYLKILEKKRKFICYQFQPDQIGSLLWALEFHSKFTKINEELVIKLADGICGLWKRDHFILDYHDLWEERRAVSRFKQNHTYTLAMVVRGLEAAREIVGENRWNRKIREMKSCLQMAFNKRLRRFVRTFGKKSDPTIDSSLLGLVWPSNQFNALDEKIVSTVKAIEKQNCKDGGVYRYKNDRYDGTVKLGILNLGGAGVWPVLNFWMSIYYTLAGEKKKAIKYFWWVLDRIHPYEYIPEQIKDNRPASIIPLAWSHAMFIITAKKLDFI